MPSQNAKSAKNKSDSKFSFCVLCVLSRRQTCETFLRDFQTKNLICSRWRCRRTVWVTTRGPLLSAAGSAASVMPCDLASLRLCVWTAPVSTRRRKGAETPRKQNGENDPLLRRPRNGPFMGSIHGLLTAPWDHEPDGVEFCPTMCNEQCAMSNVQYQGPFGLLIAHCSLLIAHCSLLIAHWRLATVHSRFIGTGNASGLYSPRRWRATRRRCGWRRCSHK